MKTAAGAGQPRLDRALSLRGAISLNVVDMVGVGPFITLPLMIAAMGGPQAMIGWVAGAAFALCDGLVWAELGAAFPQAGGSYQYLKACYPGRLGRALGFLFAWQLCFTAPLSIASGAIGLSQYAAYAWPALRAPTAAHLCAMGACLLALALLYRGIRGIGRVGAWLGAGVLATCLWVIVATFTHFHAAMAFDFPPGAFTPNRGFFLGLGAAMLLASYDYWGYYNVAFLAGELEAPRRNLPRAILISIGLVAGLYLLMNLGVLGVMPWREAIAPGTREFVMARVMERIYGPAHGLAAGRLMAGLVVWTAFASVFSLLAGYSRVPYAAAADGNFFGVFARLHPRLKLPQVALLALAAGACLFCWLPLPVVIASLVVVRLSLQFVLQTAGLLWLRSRPAAQQPARPFRMPAYPWPAVLALAGFAYVLFARREPWSELRWVALVLALGLAIFRWRERPTPRAEG